MVNWCVVCKWRSDKTQRSFHRFPTNECAKKKWQDILSKYGIKFNARSRICSRHFEEKCLSNGPPERIRLKGGSLPTLYLSYETEQPEDQCSSVGLDFCDAQSNLSASAIVDNQPFVKHMALKSLQFNTMEPNTNICCACLLSDVKMFRLSQHGLAHKMEFVTGLEALEDRVPMQLCYQCTAIINKFYFFKQKCIRANTCLKERSEQPNKHELTLERDNLNLHSALSTTRTCTLEINAKLDLRLQKENDTGGEEVTEELPILVKIEKVEPENEEGFGGIVELNEEKRNQDEIPSNRLKLEGNSEMSSHMIEVTVVAEKVTTSMKKQMPKCVKSKDVEGFGGIVEVIEEKRDQDETPPNRLKLEGNSELSSPMIEVTVVADKVTTSRKRQRPKCVKKKNVEAKKDHLAKRKPRKSRKPKSAASVESRWDCSSFSTEVMLLRDEQLREVHERCNSLNYTNSPFKCLLCFRGFLEQVTFTNHMVKHNESRGEHMCDICRYRYSSRRRLRSHLIQHQRRFKCNTCDYVSSNRWQAITHNKWHEGVLYNCPHCNASFSIHSTFVNHIRLKHPSNHMCAQCGETFQSPHGLTMHRHRSHLALEKAAALAGALSAPNGTPGPLEGDQADKKKGEERRCEECAVTFASGAAYDRHLVTTSNHAYKEKKKKAHYRRAKSAIPGPVTCGICGKGFKTHDRYEYHMRTRHAEGAALSKKREGAKRGAFMCDICGKCLSSKNILIYHIRTHTGEKPFKCDKCDSAFRGKQQRDDHFVQRHTTEKRHECPTCKRRFNSVGNMTRHTAVHSELRPYACEICGKTFKTSSSIFCHRKDVHLKKKHNKVDDGDSTNAAVAVSEGFKTISSS